MGIRTKIPIIVCAMIMMIMCFQNKSFSKTGDTTVLSFKASSATSVKILCNGLSYFLGSDTINLVKESSTVWSVTLTNIPAGFYYYRVLVDGTPLYDRGSFAYLGWGTWVNGFEIRDTSSFSEQKNGPFGNINETYYKSKVLNDFKRCFVYTPSGYDLNLTKNYPVIYLLHDTGEDESAWIYQGKINNILDNAINNGEIDPMVVVLANSNIPDTVLTYELVPFIDSIYHTLDSAKYRAIAGCAFGSKKAIKIARDHRDKFKNLGMFSLSADFDTSQSVVDSLHADNFKVLYLGAGTYDSTYISSFRFHQKLTDGGVPHNLDTSEGSFNWMVWRRNLYGMLKILFK